MNALSSTEKLAIISALIEGNSIRSIERMTGTHRDTICRLLASTGDHCEKLLDQNMRNLRCKLIQCDEIWTYVAKKQRHVRIADPVEFGDQWVFVALDAETKLIPSYLVGKRSAVSTSDFVADLSQRLANRVQITTDGFRFYVNAIERSFGSDVDFAQLVKLYSDYGQHATSRYNRPGSPWPLPSAKTCKRNYARPLPA